LNGLSKSDYTTKELESTLNLSKEAKKLITKVKTKFDFNEDKARDLLNGTKILAL